MNFKGKIRSSYDGENTEGEGTVFLEGKHHNLSFSGSASDRGVTFNLDGVEVESGSDLHLLFEEYFEEIWPDSEFCAWEATISEDGSLDLHEDPNSE